MTAGGVCILLAAIILLQPDFIYYNHIGIMKDPTERNWQARRQLFKRLGPPLPCGSASVLV